MSLLVAWKRHWNQSWYFWQDEALWWGTCVICTFNKAFALDTASQWWQFWFNEIFKWGIDWSIWGHMTIHLQKGCIFNKLSHLQLELSSMPFAINISFKRIEVLIIDVSIIIEIYILLLQTIKELDICPVPYVNPIPYSKFIKYKDLTYSNRWEDDDLNWKCWWHVTNMSQNVCHVGKFRKNMSLSNTRNFFVESRVKNVSTGWAIHDPGMIPYIQLLFFYLSNFTHNY